MTVRDDKYGRIEVSQAAIASLVAEAVKECYGVVGMSSRSRLDELAGSLQRGSRRGVEIGEDDHGIVVDIYVIVEYGMRISEVAAGVMRRVYFTLTDAAGIPVQAVNVHVQGLRVSDNGNHKNHLQKRR
jgi:uncharacterized alkaline shock family protein YloU